MNDPSRERSEILEQLTAAVSLLEQFMDVRLIPKKGSGFGYAIHGARDTNGIAAVRGRIIRDNTKSRAAGQCAFGADEDIARMILTAMKFDHQMRCAATLSYSRNLIKVIESLLLESISFDSSSEPPGISTMDWGVASCCKDGVPDVCYDYGGRGKEALIRLFGEDPIDVTNNIIMISNRIIHIEL